MTEELKAEVKSVLQKMSSANIPGIFLAFSEEKVISLRNCSDQQTAQLIINQVESTDSMKEVFVEELEALAAREIETAQSEKTN
ncbi:hypothetical protein [Chryseobacterium sp.]|uniref:hypothetical protein n=1 Tax=Chryseobacterium sp. TaxID=1871047 RepID=UPI0012A7978B|nr:hypothetical protein [Chryseobacterium sp.]QFG53669.1 hypothetical protein F7R58_08920 [Chryseobacterium sp.]